MRNKTSHAESISLTNCRGTRTCVSLICLCSAFHSTIQVYLMPWALRCFCTVHSMLFSHSIFALNRHRNNKNSTFCVSSHTHVVCCQKEFGLKLCFLATSSLLLSTLQMIRTVCVRSVMGTLPVAAGTPFVRRLSQCERPSLPEACLSVRDHHFLKLVSV